MPISYSAPVIRNPYAWPDGTAALPGVYFGADSDTGLYRIGAGILGFSIDGVGEYRMDATAFAPVANDGAALGTATLSFADLFLASESVLNFANGNITITHRANATAGLSGLILSGAAQGLANTGTTNTGMEIRLNLAADAVNTENHRAVHGQVFITSGAQAIDAAVPQVRCFEANYNGTGSSSNLNLAQFFVNNPTLGATTIASNYGIYIANLTAGTSDYGIYIAGADTLAIFVDAGTCRFDASIGIGAAPFAAQPAASIGSAGGLMIGVSSTNNLFDDASNGAGTTTMFIGNASINVTSDRRLKRDITPTVIDASVLMRQLSVKDFWWDDPSDQAPVNRNSRGRWTGLIAQDVIDVVPWLVNAPDRECLVCRSGLPCRLHEGTWQIDFAYMVPLVVKGWQEHDRRISQLEAKQA